MTETEPFNRAMVVVAHADDAEWGSSGTVAKWCRNGTEVTYVLCTNGSKGSDDLSISSEELIKIREAEQLAAAKVLGVKQVIFLGYEDSMLQPTLDLRRDIVRQIRTYRPDILICPNPVRSVIFSTISFVVFFCAVARQVRMKIHPGPSCVNRKS